MTAWYYHESLLVSVCNLIGSDLATKPLFWFISSSSSSSYYYYYYYYYCSSAPNRGKDFFIFICSFSLFSARRTTKCHSCTCITTPACVCSGGWCVNGYPVSIWGGEGGGISWVYIGRTFYLFVFECGMPSFVEIQMTSISFHRKGKKKNACRVGKVELYNLRRNLITLKKLIKRLPQQFEWKENWLWMSFENNTTTTRTTLITDMGIFFGKLFMVAFKLWVSLKVCSNWLFLFFPFFFPGGVCKYTFFLWILNHFTQNCLCL